MLQYGADEQHGDRIDHDARTRELHAQVAQFLTAPLSVLAAGHPVQRQHQRDPDHKSHNRPRGKERHVQVPALGVHHQRLVMRVFQLVVGPRPQSMIAHFVQVGIRVLGVGVSMADLEDACQTASGDQTEDQRHDRQGSGGGLKRAPGHITPVTGGAPLDHQQDQ